MAETPVQPRPQPTKQGINWKNVLIGAVIGGVLVGVGALVFYLYQSDSEEATPTTTPKTSTPSAKTSTPSAEKDETAGWKTYTAEDDGVKFSLKHPQGLTVYPPTPVQIGHILTDRDAPNGNFDEGEISVGFRVYSDVMKRKVPYGDSTFAGLKAEKGTGVDDDIGGVGVVAYFIENIKSKNNFSFECLFHPSSDTSLKKICETIADTFKFLN